jgi:thiosulfate/3-mercaptopyruvate sulfurtransferase
MNDPLVSTAWLADRLDDDTVVVVDASWHMPAAARDAAAEHAAVHIPGSAFFDIERISDHSSPLPHMLPSPSEFAVAARRLGVSSTSTVVVYDSVGLFSAPRVWWMFRAMGHDAVGVLDGGLPRWMAEGRPVETGWRNPEHGDFKAHPRPERVRDLDQVAAALADPGRQVLDARPASRFQGAAPEPRPGLRSGHMPGAVNLPFTTLIDGDSLAAEDHLRAAFAAAGVDSTKPAVTTCGSGVSAAVIALALARLGRDDAAVYDGSWSEWGARDDTAVVTGP